MPEELKLVPRSAPQSSPTLRDLLAVVFRQKRLTVITFVVVLVGVVTYGIAAPPYQAEMKVLLRRGRVDPEVAPIPSQPEFERQEITEEEVNSEVDLLQDDEILRTVVQSSGLVNHSWFWGLFGDSDEQRLARAVRRANRRLTVEPVKKAALITVSYKCPDPEQAARVLRSLASAYLERHHQLRRPTGEVSFFDEQTVESRRALEAAEVQLMAFTRDQGVVAASQERDFALQKLSAAEADAGQTEIAIAERSERVRSLMEKLNALPERIMTQIRNSDNPELMGKMKSRLLELELKRTELLTEFEPSYRSIQEVEQEIAQTRAAIAAEDHAPIRDQTSDLDSNHEWARSELMKTQVELVGLSAHAKAERILLAEYHDEAHQLADRAIQQERLLSDLKAAEEKYLLYVNKREEARMGDALDRGGILNVAIAEQPAVPALPQLSILSFGLIGIALAGTLSVGMAFVADYLSPAFRTPDELTAYLGAPVLASLPRRNPGPRVIPGGRQ